MLSGKRSSLNKMGLLGQTTSSEVECSSSKKIGTKAAQTKPEATAKEGFILFDVKILCDFLESTMKCEDCGEKNLSCNLMVDKKDGFAHTFGVECQSCPWSTSVESSGKINAGTPGKPTREVNARMVAFIRSIGRGHSALENFSLFVNSPPPMTKKNYRHVFKKSMLQVRKWQLLAWRRQHRSWKRKMVALQMTCINVQFLLMALGREGGMLAITVSWQAYLSKLASVWTLKFFQTFAKPVLFGRKRTRIARNFKGWKLHHSCKANHSGSSSSMEPVGATRIFQRSEQTRGLQYVQYLGDGDSASFKKVCDSTPYDGVDIEKLECVGHVQKRCGSRLRRLKQDHRGKKLADGKGLSGAGRLTEKVMNTLQNYYGCAIRQNTGSLEDMRKSVSAILPHVASSANNLLHHSCPDGDNSWCGYKQNPSTYKHKKGLPLPVIKIVEPIFKDLASTNLLSKCLHGKTQNANECLYKIVWDRCSKEYFVERDVVKEAAYSAVSHFNDGRIAILKVFESLHITPGRFTNFLCSAQDNRRISKSLIYMFKWTCKKAPKGPLSQKERLSRHCNRKRGELIWAWWTLTSF